MADLGKAYVQIMPSAKGISGSISNIIKPEAEAAGKSAGTAIATNISKSMGSLGSKLTKSITLPVMGTATAIGGMVGALGWGRLTGLDSAKAQLQGLGYEAGAVERISNLVNESIQGTTMTMAEGVSTAAGALAAGVEEGEDLARFIGLVGDAAVGSGRDVGEMGMIFNRVQGMGKLMTQELNMIEDGMPGFSQAMAKHFGVGQAEFRAMVTAGEVSSQDFLDVMDDFAGGMSDAYAGSWEGVVSRTRSNIGILGETMLGGVFEQSKESLAEFLEFIRTDDVRGWFADAGQAIGQTFSNILETIKGAIDWWGNLDDGIKNIILTIGGVVLAAGPVLLAISKLIAGAITISGWVGKLSSGFSVLSGVFAGISAPIALAVGAIAALVAGIVYLWQTNEEFRTVVENIWANIQLIFEEATMIISEILTMAFGTISEWWSENQQGFMDVVTTVWTAISEFFIVIFTAIGDIINAIWQPISDWYQENNELIRETIDVVWNAIADTFMEVMTVISEIVTTGFTIISNVIDAVMPYIQTIVGSVMTAILNVISLIMGIISGDWDAVWNSIKNIAQSVWDAIKALVKGAIEGVKATITSVLDAIFGDWNAKWNQIKDTVSEIWEGIKSVVSEKIEGVKTIVSEGIQGALDTVTGFFGRFREAGGNLISNIADGIQGAIGKVTGAVKNVLGAARDFLPFSPPKDKSSPLVDIHKNGIGEQIAKGILSGQDEVDRAMRNLLSFPTDGLHSELAVVANMSVSNLDSRLASNNDVRPISITQHITSPDPLTEREIARQTKLELQKLAYLY